MRGLSNCGAELPPQSVEPSQTRDGAHVPFIGRQILNHWTAGEVQIPSQWASWGTRAPTTSSALASQDTLTIVLLASLP